MNEDDTREILKTDLTYTLRELSRGEMNGRSSDVMNLAPRADVLGGLLFGALIAVGVLVLHPEFFDFDVVFGAIGIILPFLAGWLPRRVKSIYMALIGLLALVITAAIEFLITGVISEE